MGNSKRSFLNSPLFGALLGAAFFVGNFGARTLNPSYIDWQLQDDPGQHYLGWEYFRHEPWHFPPGRIVGYGTPDGSSIVYTDSIPAFALLFKALRAFLPEPFQYTGLWVLLCYALQGYFGWMLASLAMKERLPRLLAASLFIVSPAMLCRAVGHHSLMSHWLLLAALYVGLQDKQLFDVRHPRLNWHVCWSLTIILSSLVHLYLSMMVVLIYTGAAVSFLVRRKCRGINNYALLILPCLLGLATLYLEGAFVVKASNWAPSNGQFGSFSMNLWAPLVPGHTGDPNNTAFSSYFLPSRHLASYNQQFEGFNYLGLGVIVLAVVVFVSKVAYAVRAAMLGYPVRWRRAFRSPIPIPVALMTIAMALFALSNVVTLGKQTLATVQLGEHTLHFANIFRSSGRFFWPLGYLIVWATLRALGDLILRKTEIFTGLLGVIVALQILDLSQMFQHYAVPYRATAHYESPLRSRFWSEAVRHYDHILYVPPGDTSYYIPLGLLGAPEGVTINVAYKARSNNEGSSRVERELEQELRTATLRPQALYVFKNRSLYDSLKGKAGADVHLIKEVDGFFVAGRNRVGE